jgi:hypothetical protein
MSYLTPPFHYDTFYIPHFVTLIPYSFCNLPHKRKTYQVPHSRGKIKLTSWWILDCFSQKYVVLRCYCFHSYSLLGSATNYPVVLTFRLQSNYLYYLNNKQLSFRIKINLFLIFFILYAFVFLITSVFCVIHNFNFFFNSTHPVFYRFDVLCIFKEFYF